MENRARIVSASALHLLWLVALAVSFPVRAAAQSASSAAAGAATGAAPAAAAPAAKPLPFSEGIVTQRTLSLGLAKTIAEATYAACHEKGFHTAAVVVDRAGQVLVTLRDEQATAQTAEMARRKAYTARMFRMSSLDFQKRTADPTYAPQKDVADILALGGGVPIQIAGDTLGAVASSGSNQDQDDACARAGIAKVADLLK